MSRAVACSGDVTWLVEEYLDGLIHSMTHTQDRKQACFDERKCLTIH